MWSKTAVSNERIKSATKYNTNVKNIKTERIFYIKVSLTYSNVFKLSELKSRCLKPSSDLITYGKGLFKYENE